MVYPKRSFLRRHAEEMRLLKRGVTPPRFRTALVLTSILWAFWLTTGMVLLYLLSTRSAPAPWGYPAWLLWATLLAAMVAPAPTVLFMCTAVRAPRRYYQATHWILRRFSRKQRLRRRVLVAQPFSGRIITRLKHRNTPGMMLFCVYLARSMIVAGTLGSVLFSMAVFGAAICAAASIFPWCAWSGLFTIYQTNITMYLWGMIAGLLVSMTGAWLLHACRAATEQHGE